MDTKELNINNELHTAVVEGKNIPEETEGGSLLEIDGTILFVAVSFVLFTIIMQKVFYGPITQIRNNRKDYIKNIKTEARHAYEEAEKLKNEYLEKIFRAKQKNSEKTAEAINEANQEKARLLEEKKQDISEILREGRQKIEEERLKTFAELKMNISGYASEISKKILNEEIPVTGVSEEIIDNAVNR